MYEALRVITIAAVIASIVLIPATIVLKKFRQEKRLMERMNGIKTKYGLDLNGIEEESVTQQSEESTMEKKPFTVTITEHNTGEVKTMDLTGLIMFGIEDEKDGEIKATRALMGMSPREIAIISHEFENSKEVKMAKFMAAMVAQIEGNECKCENCTKKREEEETAEKEEVK